MLGRVLHHSTAFDALGDSTTQEPDTNSDSPPALPAGPKQAGAVEGNDPLEAFVPTVPRKLEVKHRLTRKGAWDMRPYGLRRLGPYLYACDSNDDQKLMDGGHCGFIGRKQELEGV
eukprot:3957338-Amphidinium_carterae.1